MLHDGDHGDEENDDEGEVSSMVARDGEGHEGAAELDCTSSQDNNVARGASVGPTRPEPAKSTLRCVNTLK